MLPVAHKHEWPITVVGHLFVNFRAWEQTSISIRILSKLATASPTLLLASRGNCSPFEKIGSAYKEPRLMRVHTCLHLQPASF